MKGKMNNSPQYTRTEMLKEIVAMSDDEISLQLAASMPVDINDRLLMNVASTRLSYLEKERDRARAQLNKIYEKLECIPELAYALKTIDELMSK